MPYKSQEQQKEANRLASQRRRDKQKGMTVEGMTQQGMTVEMVPASYVQGKTGVFESLPERPRYLTLSDGQVLDRANLSIGHTSGDNILRMQSANESAYNYHPVNNPEGYKRALKAIT